MAFGDESCDIILREAVARGADEAILVQGAEDIRNAAAAAAALKKVIAAEKADKILMGSRSGNHFQKTAGELLTALMPVDVITAGEGSVGHMYAGRVFEVYANDCVRTADAGLEEKAFPAVGYENCKRARMQKKVTGTPEEAADAIAAFLEEIDFRKDRGTGRAAVLTCGNGSFTFVPATEEGIAFAAGLAQKEKLPVLGGCVDAAIRDGKMQISIVEKVSGSSVEDWIKENDEKCRVELAAVLNIPSAIDNISANVDTGNITFDSISGKMNAYVDIGNITCTGAAFTSDSYVECDTGNITAANCTYDALTMLKTDTGNIAFGPPAADSTGDAALTLNNGTIDIKNSSVYNITKGRPEDGSVTMKASKCTVTVSIRSGKINMGGDQEDTTDNSKE